jgi:hypothetical protein
VRTGVINTCVLTCPQIEVCGSQFSSDVITKHCPTERD